MVLPPDYGKTLDAFRAGQTDFLAQKKRDLLKEAGGLAAAGNMAGAKNKLYSGGEFGEAREHGSEMRAQSAEQRAIQSHAKSMDDARLAKFGKMQEMLGNITDYIMSDPNQSGSRLEQAKALLKSRGLDASSVTLEQLPMLKQQNIGIQQAINNEFEERRLKNSEAESLRVQSNVDRSFSNQLDQQRIAQSNTERSFANQIGQQQAAQDNADRTFLAGREDANENRSLRQLQIDVMRKRAEAQAAKANAPKPLTESQASSRNFLGMMEKAEKNMQRLMQINGGKSPVSSRAMAIYQKSPNWMSSPLLNKREKEYIQAAEQWYRAKLRKESGATIGADEARGEVSAFIPLADDSQGTIRQKNEGRGTAHTGFRTMGGLNAPGAPEAEGAGDVSDMSDEELGALFQ